MNSFMNERVEERYGHLIDTVQPGTPCVVCGKPLGGSIFSGHWCWKALMFGDCPDNDGGGCHLYEPDMQWLVIDEYLQARGVRSMEGASS